MPHWLIKAGVQRAISVLPKHHVWNELLQERVRKSLGYNQRAFEEGLGRARALYDSFRAFHPAGVSFNALEIGTGWYPVVPISLRLCGASDIWCFDVEQYVRPKRLAILLQFFVDYAESGALERFLSTLRPDPLQQLRAALAVAETDVIEALEQLNIHVRVPDATKTGLPEDSVDLLYSIGTLQHIPRPVLAAIFAELRRISRADAVMVHSILLKDQYSTFDRSLSQLNYLRYSSRAWKWLNSPLTPQNRLRVSDYRALTREAGFKLKRENNTPLAEAELRRIELAAEFRNYAKEDLLVSWSEMVSQR